jgi:hypothetical protein
MARLFWILLIVCSLVAFLPQLEKVNPNGLITKVVEVAAQVAAQ